MRIGILGAGRGAYLGQVMDRYRGAQVVAMCDHDPVRLEQARQRLPHLQAAYLEIDAFLNHDFELAVIANDATAHASPAIRALRQGRHVLSEVVACNTLAEAVALARAVEEASRSSSPPMYAFGENCCTMRPTLEIKRLYRAGDLGEYLYGECEYVHDCTGIWPRLAYGDPDHWRNWLPATGYCTHALGPILDITGTRPVRCVGLTTPNRLGRLVGRQGDDMGVFLCQMDNGAVTKVLTGLALRREPSLHWYSLYGTRGQAENQRGPGEELLHVYLEQDRAALYGRSYVPEFPYTLDWVHQASGHGGADEYMIDALMRALLAGAPPPIDVYMALDMTLPGILAHRSACQGSAPLEVPDLRQEVVRLRYESDNWSPDPLGCSSEPAPSSAHGAVDIPAEVYDQQRLSYRP
jgi:predicted dehydrogenase